MATDEGNDVVREKAIDEGSDLVREVATYGVMILSNDGNG